MKPLAVSREKPPRGEYTTKGYLWVKDVLENAKGAHLAAEDVFELLERKGRKIGRTTVYRQLERLVAEGIAQKIQGGPSGACYRRLSEECGDRYHILCTVCGNVSHLTCDKLEAIFSHVQTEHGFQIDMSRTVLYGICSVCNRNRKRKERTE
ncbi:MAG: transcriptional repressor [Clostridia bacterium]|nr:transcriptional repressor [Clostridia bacterium]